MGLRVGLVLVVIACGSGGGDADPAPDAALMAPDASVTALDASAADGSVHDASGADATPPDAAPPDAALTACRNFDALDPSIIDPTRECVVAGEFCFPDSLTLDVGYCRPGSGCVVAEQTGCDVAQTCHPVAGFGLDNTDATVCLEAGSGDLGAACSTVDQCAAGLACAPVYDGRFCVPYCNPEAPDCPAGTMCVDVSLEFDAVIRPSFAVAICS